jgi:hypothetical protein
LTGRQESLPQLNSNLGGNNARRRDNRAFASGRALNLASADERFGRRGLQRHILLIPLLNSAYRALLRELAENGVSGVVEQQDLELDLNSGTGATNLEISDVSSPQLSTDCLMPHMLWERAAAKTSDVFVLMEKFTSVRRDAELAAQQLFAALRVA